MKYIIQNNIIMIDMGDELLLSIGDDKVVQLKGTSKTVFNTLSISQDIDDIASAIRTEYLVEIEDSELKNDINECIDMLVQNGILVLDIQ